jgi:uncharacterized membrane protein YfcA
MLWRRGKSFREGSNQPQMTRAILAGFCVGVLTGLLGVGGGFLIVPALILFGGIGVRMAIGTSLFVIFLNCVAGLVGHLGQGMFDWNLTGSVTGFAIAGAVGGTILSRRMAPNGLQSSFALLVLFVGAFLVVSNYSSIF